MLRQRPRPPLLPWLLCLLATIPLPASASQPITVDPSSHYLLYNGQAVPLVGISYEYLPHLSRPSKSNAYCTYDTALASMGCLDFLAQWGNTFRVWVSLNSSIGVEDQGAPYPIEQPFVYNNGLWNLDAYDDAGFFAQLKNVLDFANQRGLIVEVTLIDQHGDKQHSGPWVGAHNTGNIQFTNSQYITSFDNVTGDSSANQPARTKQRNLISHIVNQLKSYPNFYWEIANEPDQPPDGPAWSSNQINGMVNWHKSIADLITTTEASLPYQHLIAANFWSASAINAAAASGKFQIINSHYNLIIPATGVPALYGAIPMQHSFPGLAPAFGFNETKATPCPSLAGAGAEAWEFMTGKGTVVDNYSLDWTHDSLVEYYLLDLQQFLTPLSLRNLIRDAGTAPPWASGVPAYNSNNTYWSSMEWPGNQYALYIHHSTIPDPTGLISRFKRYAPLCNSSGYHHTLGLSLGSTPWYYKAEWFLPSDNASRFDPFLAPACSQSIQWSGSGTFSVNSPWYPYDLALRVTKCPTNAPCTTNTVCSTVPPACPPPDPPSC